MNDPYLCYPCSHGVHDVTHGTGCLSADCGCEVDIETRESRYIKVLESHLREHGCKHPFSADMESGHMPPAIEFVP